MNSSNILARQGHRLLQIGVALFLFTSFEGFAIPYFASPIVGRSVHTLSALFGLILVAFGLLWPRLRLNAAPARIAFWFLVYSGLAITAAFFLAAMWDAGQSVMPLSGASRGTAVQEAAITAVSYTSAPTGIIAFALILWGLRTPSNRAAPTLDERRG
jgi:(hydroxyamino)benzene mutase